MSKHNRERRIERRQVAEDLKTLTKEIDVSLYTEAEVQSACLDSVASISEHRAKKLQDEFREGLECLRDLFTDETDDVRSALEDEAISLSVAISEVYRHLNDLNTDIVDGLEKSEGLAARLIAAEEKVSDANYWIGNVLIRRSQLHGEAIASLQARVSAPLPRRSYVPVHPPPCRHCNNDFRDVCSNDIEIGAGR